MFQVPKALLVSALLGTLAACSSGGGGGGGSPSPQPNPEPEVTVEDYLDEATMIAEEMEELDFTDPSALPSGSVNYEGVLALEAVDSDYGVAGNLELEAAFDDNAISGSVTDLVDTEGTTYTSNVVIGDGMIYPDADVQTEWTYDAAMSGTVTGGGDTFVIDGELFGNFFGADASHTAGEVYVESCGDEGCTDYEGGFIGRQAD